MLRKETVNQVTLELLNTLMEDQQLDAFFLVGGTALSLQIGHRISIDLDLFSTASFEENTLLEYLENKYHFQLDYQSKNTLKGSIRNVKVDFITHGYPLILPLIVDEKVRMAGIEDIAAMKLNAIAGNGTRLKDFIDIAYLSPFLSLAQMVDAYEHKYASRNPVMLIKALGYHNDINFDEPIQMISENYSWKWVRGRLSAMTNNPEKTFALG